MKFHVSSRAYHHGQHDLTLTASRDGVALGRIDFSVYAGVPHIQMIEVAPEARRSGIGRALVQRLQQDYPDVEIEWGAMTPEGGALYDALNFDVQDQPEVMRLQKRLQRVKDRLARYAALADRFFTGRPSDADLARFHQETADWNDLHDLEVRLEQQLEGRVAQKKIIRTPTRA